MTECTPRDERRNCKRLLVAHGAFAALKDQTGHVGRIIDISREGLTVRYLPKALPVGNLTEIDIVSYDDRFLLEGIPIRAISDISNDEPFPSSQVPMRRLGLRFGQLTREQSSQLDYFIQRHTQGEDG